MKIIRYRLTIEGEVVGVNFRAYVYQLAIRYGLCGFVKNDFPQVIIEIEGGSDKLDQFLVALKTKPPHFSKISAISTELIPLRGEDRFSVLM